uniref:Putative Restriction modification system DNA specificity domain n=1 Tax=mine drainage metagenome TaxID=410659 RepID=E6QLE9_9ZZZZ
MDLPKNWAHCTVADITTPIETIDFAGSNEHEVSYVDIGSINNKSNIILEPKHYRLSEAPSRARQIIKSGDVLFSTVRPYLRNIAQVPESLDGQIASTGFAVLRAPSGVNARYLFYKAISYPFVSALSGVQYGASYPAVRDEQVRAQLIELPPTQEQRRIVAKIEELFSELDKGVEALTTAREQLKAYRQSVLKHAFEGKLTDGWRIENAGKIEEADILSGRLVKEREERYRDSIRDWQAALAKWRTEGGGDAKPAKPSSPRELSKLAKAGSNNGRWALLELGDVLSVSSGTGLTSQQMREGPYPVYGGNGINGSHDEYFVDRPELTIGRVGAKCGVTHITIPKCWVTDNALIVKPLIKSFNKRFFKWLLDTKNLNGLGSSTGQPVISGSKIYPVMIVVPSLHEQSEVVRILEDKIGAADRMTAEIDEELVRSNALRQSILKEAFSGQFVAQDPTDEPASVLLERIRAERNKADAKKPGRKTKKIKKEKETAR